MASEKVTAMIEEIKAMSVLELSELVHEIEDVFGVSAAAAVAAPAPSRSRSPRTRPRSSRRSSRKSALLSNSSNRPLHTKTSVPSGTEVFLRLSGNLIGFPDRRLAGCCAQTLCAGGVQSPHLQPEMYFLSRTCRERK